MEAGQAVLNGLIKKTSSSEFLGWEGYIKLINDLSGFQVESVLELKYGLSLKMVNC